MQIKCPSGEFLLHRKRPPPNAALQQGKECSVMLFLYTVACHVLHVLPPPTFLPSNGFKAAYNNNVQS